MVILRRWVDDVTLAQVPADRGRTAVRHVRDHFDPGFVTVRVRETGAATIRDPKEPVVPGTVISSRGY